MKEETLEGLLTRIENDDFGGDLIYLLDSPSIESSALRSKGIFYKIGTPSWTVSQEGEISEPVPARGLSLYGKRFTSRKLYSDFLCLKSLYNTLPKHVVEPYALVVDSTGCFIGYLIQYVPGQELGRFIMETQKAALAASLKGAKTYATFKRKARQKISKIKRQINEIIEIMRKNALAHGDLCEGNVMLEQDLNSRLVDPGGSTHSLKWRQRNDLAGRSRIFRYMDDALVPSTT
jgi:hypothetical protein